MDEFLLALGDEKARRFVVGLAEDSENSSRFSVLLNIADHALARRALAWNGGQKIHEITKPVSWLWKREELQQYYEKWSVFVFVCEFVV